MEFIIISIVAAAIFVVTIILSFRGVDEDRIGTDEDRIYKAYSNKFNKLLGEEEFLERYLEENGLELKFKTFRGTSTFSTSSKSTESIKW